MNMIALWPPYQHALIILPLKKSILTLAIQQPSANIAQRQYTFPRRGGFHDMGRVHRGGYNSSNRNHDQPSIVCQICGKIRHSAKKCYFRFDLSYQDAPPLQAKHGLVAMRHGSNNAWETAWHADTGATHHITNDANNLTLQKTDYTGVDSVQVGNGQGL